MVMWDFCWGWLGWLHGTSVGIGKAGYVGLLLKLVRLFFLGISKAGACMCVWMCAYISVCNNICDKYSTRYTCFFKVIISDHNLKILARCKLLFFIIIHLHIGFKVKSVFPLYEKLSRPYMNAHTHTHTCVKFELGNTISMIIMEVHGNGFHPGIVCVAWIVHVASVNLEMTQLKI